MAEEEVGEPTVDELLAQLNEATVLTEMLRNRTVQLNLEIRARDKQIEQHKAANEALTRALSTAQEMIADRQSDDNSEKEDDNG